MGEEEELYNLINMRIKPPLLNPIPPLPLLLNTTVSSKSLYKRLKFPPKLTKKISTSSTSEEQSEIFKPKLPKSFYIIKLKEWAEEIPISGLMPSWEENILNLIPRSLKKKYQKYLDDLMTDVKSIYIREMQEFAVSSIVINDRESETDDLEEETEMIIPMEKPWVTQNNKLFIKNRKKLKKNYFLSENLMKQIISTARAKLTNEIVDFSIYRDLGLSNISDFQYLITKNIRNSTSVIKHEYYKEIMKRVLSKKHLKRIEKTDESKFMRCATNLFVQQILQNMMETIIKMLETIKNSNFCPQFNFELLITEGIENFDDYQVNISLDPSIEKVSQFYHQVIDDISNIVKNDLLCFKCEDLKENYIQVEVPKWFLIESHEKLSRILEDLFRPLKDHFLKVVEEFTYVCTSKTRDLILDLVSDARNFEIYCNHVKKFNTYLKKSNGMVSYLYYDIGRLDQTSAKKNLHKNITDLVQILMNKLISHHWNYNRTIYDEIESLKATALDIPKNAKALFELSETMSLASTVTVEKLEKKLEKSIEMLSELVQLTDLTEDHIEFNKKTINLLFSIPEVFNQCNTLCEAMKSELEDELQRKINILNIKVEEIIPEFIIMDNMDDASRVHEYIEFLKILVDKVKEVDEEIRAINLEEKLFKFPETAFPRVEEIKDIIIPFYNLNKMIFLWKRHYNVWLNGPFEYINASEVENITLHYFDEFTDLNKSIKTRIKLDMTTPNKPFKFSGIIDDPDPMQQPAPLKLCFQMIQNVRDFKQYVRLVNCVCNPALAKRHWNEMSVIYGSDITPNAGTTLKKIIRLDLMENIEKYEVISISANKELALQKQLDCMAGEWRDVLFDIVDDGAMLSFLNYENIQIKMEEHLVKIQEMKGSYFVKPIADDVFRFHRGLIRVKDTVDRWNLVQEQLIVVKPVFEYSKNAEMRKSGDFGEFEVIFEACRNIEECLSWVKGSIMENPSFQGIEGSWDYLNKLGKCQLFIDIANEKINEHLDKMRRIFPRFFFLANNEIMEILFGKSGNNIVGLLRKCFSGIKNVKFDSNGEIIGILTDYDQEFNLYTKINVGGINWAVETEASIIGEVKETIISNIAGEIEDSDEFIKNFVSNIFSVSFCTLKIFWTSKLEKCLENSVEHSEELRLILQNQNSLISSVIKELKNENLAEKILRKNQRLILTALASILIHQRDVISLLITNEVVSEEDFNWMSQLRHYYREQTIKVEMIYAIKDYGYEFNSVINNSFVNTPLTERIYHTIFQASKNNYFCSLIGPSDTGKTETIKYLAINELGYQYYLINSTENMTCRRISNILKGLIACGAWVCFKDLNNMKISMLSSITQKFDQILKLISMRNSKIEEFDGDSLIVKNSGFIVANLTINPGNSSMFLNKKTIPDNLKSLFRPITVNRPDLKRICEINLFSSGFKNARKISEKMEIIYKFSEQLNYGKNYLFGLRSLISIVKNSVRLKFQFSCEENEEIIVLRSIIDVHLPILKEEDVPIFLGSLRDTFKDIKMIPPNYNNFLRVLNDLAKSEVFEVHQTFKLKIIQILEILFIKNSFIIVGESFTGKTKILTILSKCLTKLLADNDDLGVRVVMEVINHKSMKLNNLFGFNEKVNNNVKWIDGICTSMLRRFSATKELNCRKWLIFDGPIESPWMESFITIMGNKTLLLESGEKIQFSDEISLIIETEDLNDSTPGIISRCGIVNMEIETIGWLPHMKSWIIEQNVWIKPEKNEFMENLLKWSLEFALKFVRIHCDLFLKVTDVFLVTSTLRLLKIRLLEAFDSNNKEGTVTHFDFHFEIWFQACLILSIIWGIGGALSSDDSRNKLDESINSNWSKKPENICANDVSLPEGLIQDYNYIFRSSGQWKLWTELIKNSTEFFVDPKFIPTANSIKLITIIESHINRKIPFILCGDRSVGKTMTMKFILKKRLSDKYLPNVFNFTRKTTADQAQKYFLLKINRIMKGRYSPPKDKYSINFIDDLNMIIDEEKTVDSGLPLELIRQLIDHGYWYRSSDDEEKFQKIFLDNVMFVSALTLSERNSTSISSRFIRHFNLYSLNPPSKENIFRIFSSLLLNNLKKNQFSADVSTSVNGIVNSTIHVYNSILSSEKYRAIPLNKFAYQFNLRDIGKVISGCSLIQRESAETKVTLIRLWVNESLRVFADRTTDKHHHNHLFSLMKEAIGLHFPKESFDSIFDHLPKQNDQLTSESFESLMFCNFIDPGDHKDDFSTRRRKYEEVTLSKEAIRTKLLTYLNQLNGRSDNPQKIDIIIFSDVIAHLIRLCRCLCIPSGNFLMLSIGGGSTGRRSLTKLSSFIQKSEFFELTNNSAWREDLKRATRHIASTGNDSSFFIPCRYLNDDHLMDINSLMSTGEIPDLYINNDERQDIIKCARLPAQNGDRNLEVGIIEVMNYFHEQCQEKLHFILYINLFDEVGNGVNNSYQLLKPYANILNFCYIDCFEDWPQEAFALISNKFLHDLALMNTFTKEKVAAASINIYEDSKAIKSTNNYKTTVGPYAFIHMMKIYSRIIMKKHEKITESRHRYQVGLEKLQYAEQEVSKMKTTLIELKPQLEWSAKQTEETMREIESENIIVENAKIQVKKDEEIANKVAGIAATLKAECEADLAVAIPILEDAIAALNTLKPTDITLVKAMKNPPDTVKLVLAAVCVMLNVSSDRVIDPVTGRKSMDYWGPSKRILGEMNFLQLLKDYDKDHIPPSLMAIVKKTYMTDKNFMPHIVAKASSAAEGLCKWVRAMVSYDEVAKIVAPKKEKLAAAEKECNESLAFLNEKRKILAELTNKLIGLNETLRETLAKKLELENEVRNCTEKLGKSEGLIASLDSEKIKWRKSLDLLKNSLDTLPGDLLVSCGIIAFLSSFDNNCRNETVERWKEIIQNERISISKTYDFLFNLESDITIESWHFAGLSRNRFYEENGVIMKNSELWCLLIDPQHQANLWIRKTEEKNHLKVFKSSEIHNSEYLEGIRQCMEFNRPVMLENLAEDFGPFDLDTIYALRNEKITNELTIYMTTRLSNPSFNPYILKKTNVINFHLPEDALHEQLLDIVVSREQPELQEKFNDLNIKSNVNRQILKQEEKNILSTLSSTSTSVSILEDEKALKILDTSKKLSVEIRQKEEATRSAKMEIDQFRMLYRRFTSFSAGLYNTLTSLAALNHMYQFSLVRSFTQLFTKSIDTSKRSYLIDKRLEYLKCSFTQTLHTSVRNALFEDHKIIYTFLLCLKLLSSDDDFVMVEEVDYFFETIKSFNSDELPERLNELIMKFPVFQGIVESLESEKGEWEKLDEFPVPWNTKLTSFQKILLMKILRPDKLIQEIQKFVDSVMKKFKLSVPTSEGISQSYSESTCLIPLIFILPTYVQPLEMIREFGKKFGYTSKIFTVSLGGEDDHEIDGLIANCQREGSWILIQNCHLADSSTMFLLERIYENQNIMNNALIGFRLWLSSYPTKNFPVGILQDGIKIASSSPKDLKKSLKTCYQSDPVNKLEFFSSCPGNDKTFAKMIYGVAVFHSILRERRKFGCQGFNVNYDFFPSDFTISVRQLRDLLRRDFSGKEIRYFVEGIFHLVGKCNYGGRIIEEEDENYVLEVLKNLLNREIVAKKNYCVFGELSGNFVAIPNRCEFKDFLKHIDNIEDCYEILEVFGLDDNVRGKIDFLAVRGFVDSVNLLNDGFIEGRENFKIYGIEELNGLPELFDVDEVKRELPFEYSEALNYVLIQEIDYFNATIKKLKLFIQNGGDLEDFIGKNRILEDSKIDGTVSLSNWIREFNEKSIFFKNWIQNKFPKEPIKLGLISFPRKFISTIKIMFSREYSIDVTKINIKSEIMESKNSAGISNLVNDKKSIYIDGLVLSGGKWNEVEGKLVVNDSKEFFSIFPIVRLTPELIEQCDSSKSNVFLCPLYKSVNDRDLVNFSGNFENFIVRIELKSDFSKSFWVKRGAALFCRNY